VLLQSIERLSLAFASLQQPFSHDTTPAALGDKTMQRLQKLGTVTDFTGDEAAGPAALDVAAQQRVAQCKSETELVKQLTPVLWRLRTAGNDSSDACRPVLVNSEQFKWLDNLRSPLRPDMRLKPDLFVTPRVFVEEREGTGSQGTGDEFIFGLLADRRLQGDGCVSELYEAKVDELTLKHLGELVSYHRLIPGECRGMLFNGRHFWLYASHDGDPLKLLRGAWAAPGSASCVRRFFDDGAPPPPLVPLLRQLLSALRLRPAPDSGGSSFLGGGGSGRVFAVQHVEHDDAGASRRAAPRLALKVVPAAASASWLSDLDVEFKALQDAAKLGAPVVPVVADSLRALQGLGGGFLLAHCGAPFDATASAAACAAAFAALAALHACGIMHGDARLPNLLLVRGRAAWVDLAVGTLASTEHDTRAVSFRADADTLTQSVLKAAGVNATPLPPSIALALAAYDGSSADAAHALAAAAWAAAVTGRSTLAMNALPEAAATQPAGLTS
jgi:hypothetical protein